MTELRVDVPVLRGDGETVIDPPGSGDGFWAGAPSAVCHDGVTYLAYRLRRPVQDGRGYQVVIARSSDGLAFETIASLTKEECETASLERPALVRRPDGGWRLYVSCSTPGSAHWWIDTVDADDPAAFRAGDRRTAFPGDADTAVKDPVIVPGPVWNAWICCHPLDDPDATDRMTTRHATSHDGVEWTWGSVALAGRPGAWDARGARVAAVVRDAPQPFAFYDGRASAAENWYERTGFAIGNGDATFTAVGDAPIGVAPQGTGALRYVTLVEAEDGYRAYYEASRADGSNEIRTERIAVKRR